MQHNLFAEITSIDEKIQKFRVAPPKLSSNHSIGDVSIERRDDRGTAAGKKRKSSSSARIEKARQDNNSFATYFRVSVDNVDKVTENNLLRTSFIIYQIRFTRLSDLADRAVWKRYKELYTFYLELLEAYPELENDENLQFPTYDKWTNSKDVNSEFIHRRRADLETFFRNLISCYPALAKFPRLVEFFELDYLPSEDVSMIMNYYNDNEDSDSDSNQDQSEDDMNSEDDEVNEDNEKNTENRNSFFGFRRNSTLAQNTVKKEEKRRVKPLLFRYDKEKSVLASVQRSGLVYDPVSASLVPRYTLESRNNTGEVYSFGTDGWLVREGNRSGTHTSVASFLRYPISYSLPQTVLPCCDDTTTEHSAAPAVITNEIKESGTFSSRHLPFRFSDSEKI